jgi:membrane-associated phospholipid phosphatase
MRPPSLVFLACFAAIPAYAGHFIPDNALDYRALLTPPPAADSLVTRAELDVVLQFQDLRTPALAKRAQEIENETLFSFAGDVVGPWFTAEKLPQTAALFAAVREDFIPVNRASKALWPRKRPPYADARVKPCVEYSDSGSYPSGHGIQSALWAVLLSELLPDHAAGFQARALETRRLKLFTGVHYPSDLEAGRILGEALAREMLKSPALQTALADARAEIAAAAR